MVDVPSLALLFTSVGLASRFASRFCFPLPSLSLSFFLLSLPLYFSFSHPPSWTVSLVSLSLFSVLHFLIFLFPRRSFPAFVVGLFLPFSSLAPSSNYPLVLDELFVASLPLSPLAFYNNESYDLSYLPFFSLYKRFVMKITAALANRKHDLITFQPHLSLLPPSLLSFPERDVLLPSFCTTTTRSPLFRLCSPEEQRSCSSGSFRHQEQGSYRSSSLSSLSLSRFALAWPATDVYVYTAACYSPRSISLNISWTTGRSFRLRRGW